MHQVKTSVQKLKSFFIQILQFCTYKYQQCMRSRPWFFCVARCGIKCAYFHFCMFQQDTSPQCGLFEVTIQFLRTCDWTKNEPKILLTQSFFFDKRYFLLSFQRLCQSVCCVFFVKIVDKLYNPPLHSDIFCTQQKTLFHSDERVQTWD